MSGVQWTVVPRPFAPSEVEGPYRAKPRSFPSSALGFARQGVSTSLDTNGFRA
jgi:hypothetical protein